MTVKLTGGAYRMSDQERDYEIITGREKVEADPGGGT